MGGGYCTHFVGALAALTLTTLASAQISFGGEEVSRTPPPASSCVAPPAATSFLTSDAAVYLFFNATVSSSDSLSSDWLAPDGSVFPGSTWNAQAGAFCFSSSALAIGNTPENRLGTWQARVYDNGAPLFSVTFSVSAAPS